MDLFVMFTYVAGTLGAVVIALVNAAKEVEVHGWGMAEDPPIVVPDGLMSLVFAIQAAF